MAEKEHKISFFGILGILFLVAAIIFYVSNAVSGAQEFFEVTEKEGKTAFNIIFICISAILVPCILVGPFVKKIRRGMLIAESILIMVISVVLIILGEVIQADKDIVLCKLIEIYIENVEWSIVASVSGFGCMVLDRIMVMNKTYDDAEERFDSDFSNVERMCEFCGRVLVGDEVCNCRETASETTEKSFCIYCGRVLHGDEQCSCGMSEAYAAPEEHSYTTPETYGSTAPVQTGFCTLCGRVLYNGEKCKCTEAESARTVETHSVPISAESKKEETSAMSDGSGTVKGLKSTMRTKEKVAPDYKDVENNEKGKAFLNKAGEL